MSNRLTKRSRTSYVAAVPATPARPAYCVTTTGDSIEYIRVPSLNSGIESAPGHAPIIKFHYNAKGEKVIDEVYIPVVVHNAKITTCYPAVQAVRGSEAKNNTDGQVGWSSGARSSNDVSGDFDVSFQLPAIPSGAVLCGLSETSAVVGQFSAIQHGVYTSGTALKFYEAGVEKHTFAASASSGPRIHIRRIAGVVESSVAGETYRSGTRSSGSKSIMAALYAAGDYVDNPQVVSAFAGSSSSPLALGAEGPRSKGSTLLSGFASGKDAAPAVEPVVGIDGVVTVFDISMAAISSGLMHDQGVEAADLSPGVMSSEEFQTVVRFVMDDPTVSAYGSDQLLEVDIVEGLIPLSAYDFTPFIFATISESLQLGSVLEVVVAIDARLIEILALPTNASASMVLEAVLRSGLLVSDFSSQARNEALQYATNIATGAVTRYSGFGFNSFCRVGTDLWATKSDGLYKVAGETDNGELLSFLIDFAADDQGSQKTKRLENIFFGITTDGYTLARLTDDFGREQVYRLIQRDSSEARINTAKGASSRFWKLRLEGEAASYAEIDNIEWVAATGARRTKR